MSDSCFSILCVQTLSVGKNKKEGNDLIANKTGL